MCQCFNWFHSMLFRWKRNSNLCVSLLLCFFIYLFLSLSSSTFWLVVVVGPSCVCSDFRCFPRIKENKWSIQSTINLPCRDIMSSYCLFSVALFAQITDDCSLNWKIEHRRFVSQNLHSLYVTYIRRLKIHCWWCCANRRTWYVHCGGFRVFCVSEKPS